MCEKDWRHIAEDFQMKWQFPHCVGALDGKHVALLAPPQSGSVYYNYKHFHSIVLLALVDANYRFIYVDIGNYGRIADGGVYQHSTLATAMASNALGIPPPDDVAGCGNLPYVIVADDAFALKPYLMKPYPLRGLTPEQNIFNYRLSRARRTVENAFGILSSRFRIFRKAIPLAPEKVETVTMAACCLHNFLLRNKSSSAVYMSGLLNDDTGSNEQCNSDSTMQHVHRQGGNRPPSDALKIRDMFCVYFSSPHGSVCWQSYSHGD